MNKISCLLYAKGIVGAPLWGERDENQYKVYNYIY